MAFKCDFTAVSILLNAIRSMLWERIERQARDDRITLGAGCTDRIIVVDRIDMPTLHIRQMSDKS